MILIASCDDISREILKNKFMKYTSEPITVADSKQHMKALMVTGAYKFTIVLNDEYDEEEILSIREYAMKNNSSIIALDRSYFEHYKDNLSNYQAADGALLSPMMNMRLMMLNIERFECLDTISFSELLSRYHQIINFELYWTGLDANHVGYNWIVDCLTILTLCDNYNKNYKKYLFPVIMEKYGVTGSAVESGIRRCINAFVSSADDIVRREILGPFSDSTTKVSISEYMRVLCDRIIKYYPHITKRILEDNRLNDESVVEMIKSRFKNDT